MTSELPDNPLRFVIAGRLNRDTIIPISGEPQIDGFGGNLAYAAIGLKLWGKAGLLALVRIFPGLDRVYHPWALTHLASGSSIAI